MKNKRGQYYVQVSCSRCSCEYMKRKDSISSWSGLCKSCSMTDVANRPELLEIKKEVGRRVMASAGKLPHYPNNYRSGPANNLWRGGITSEIRKIRSSKKMVNWRTSVFKRDNYTCQICDKRGGDMNADHIKPFSLFPDLRFDVSNGRTLCVPCHRQFGAKVSNGRITREAISRDGTNWRIG